jgi:cell wall-associated NlpC family hydrolase
MIDFDKRITAARHDLAAASLKGKVQAKRYSEGETWYLACASAPLRRAPRNDAPLDTEVLMGEQVTVYDIQDGWAWVQLQRDGYVGYMPDVALSRGTGIATHEVIVPRTFTYPGPSMKLPPVEALSLGCSLEIIEISGDFARTRQGLHLWARHLSEVKIHALDFVMIAECFLNIPYLWGGKTSLGLDCSGLTQISLAAAGIAAPRDSDQQEGALGATVPIAADISGLRRGDLVFWQGHVGIMRDAQTLLHANGHHMMVVSEPLSDAVDRISQRTQSAGTGAGQITSVRRLA